jgi:hypothetical protein
VYAVCRALSARLSLLGLLLLLEAASLPGASPGIFHNVTQYDGYYYVGNDAYGQPIWRFFQTGTY